MTANAQACRAIPLVVALTASLAAPFAPLPAQQPRPAGETAPTWTAEEGAALCLLQELVAARDAARQRGEEPILERLPYYRRIGTGYRYGFFTQGDDGRLTALKTAGRSAWCVYAWPEAYGESGEKAFFLASHGPLLVTDNRREHYDGEAKPEPHAALGRGGQRRLSDVLRGPGVGEDGQFWQTLETIGQAACEIEVVDEDGEPMDRVQVGLLPASAFKGRRGMGNGVPTPSPAPVGTATTDARGRVTLRGPTARDVLLAVGVGSGWLPLHEHQLQRTASGLKLTVTLGDFMTAAANANESAAIATLKNISSAQAQCQASAVIDANKNGAGEYGFFAELSGGVPVRSDGKGGVGDKRITPPVLSGAFQRVAHGRVVRSGYVFQIFLPGAGKTLVAEAPTGGGRGVAVDPPMAEVVWRCYAWPVAAGRSGQRAFFVDQAGDVMAVPNAAGRYSGHEQTPECDAAIQPGDDDWRAAANTTGRDGQRWVVIS